MANNTTLPGTGDVVRDIDRGTAKTQVVQLDHGGSASEILTSDTNPLPVNVKTVGQQVKAASVPVTLASNDDSLALFGAVTETAPGSDTASSGLNGRLQRIAQRLTSLIALVPASLGQKAMSASLAVVLASDQGTVGVQAGKSTIVSANFTRPADTTAYAVTSGVGDLVANNTAAGSVTPLTFNNIVRVSGAGALVRKAKLRKSNASTVNASFRIHFYAVTETMSVGDNTAIVLPDTANYRGSIDITMDRAFGDGACGFGIPAVGDAITVNPASGTSLFAFIEVRAAYTPASAEVFTVELDVLQD